MRAMDALVDAMANGPLNKEQIEVGYKKILQFKLDKIKNPDPMPLQEALGIINNDQHKKVAEAIATGVVPDDLFKENEETV